MKRFKNILLVSDHGMIGNAVFHRAVSLATENHAKLTLLEVIEEPREMQTFADPARMEGVRKRAVRELQEQLEEVMAPAGAQGIETAATVLVGTPFIEIIREVMRKGHDLVMMMTEGKSGLKDRLFGSTSLHLMRKCPCPVWVMKPKRQKTYARILAAVDPDSADERRNSLNVQIMDLATSLAEMEDSELHVLHVWSTWPKHFLSKHGDMSGQEVDEIAGEILAARESELDNLVSGYGLEEADHQVHFVVGEARSMIPRLAASQRVDLIVMGTVCRTGFAGFFIGNTAESVLQQVNCSVLVLKPEGFVSPVESEETCR
ncbi:MAG: universal stress protein [Phycisphaerae bacterium]|jgi:nucleotide-binding universal stress UspA family protein|nr:universal stress protein [Phycisphaerae bacterium]